MRLTLRFKRIGLIICLKRKRLFWDWTKSLTLRSVRMRLTLRLKRIWEMDIESEIEENEINSEIVENKIESELR